jgi:hypothetical protein
MRHLLALLFASAVTACTSAPDTPDAQPMATITFHWTLTDGENGQPTTCADSEISFIRATVDGDVRRQSSAGCDPGESQLAVPLGHHELVLEALELDDIASAFEGKDIWHIDGSVTTAFDLDQEADLGAFTIIVHDLTP